MANTNPKTLDSRVRCYNRVAICASRTRRANDGYFLKETKKETGEYFVRGNYERKYAKIPTGHITAFFVKELTPNGACVASCPLMGTLRKRSKSTPAAPGCTNAGAHYDRTPRVHLQQVARVPGGGHRAHFFNIIFMSLSSTSEVHIGYFVKIFTM